eukprot:scaffold1507_cov158-Ochromonas_danica.AAC.23
MDSTTRREDGALTNTSCPRLSSALSLLQESPFFKRKNGSDHFLIHSINHMMLFFNNEYCARLYKVCRNCLKLSIDHYDESVYPELRRMPHLVERWYSIPFPSNYHRSVYASTDLFLKFPLEPREYIRSRSRPITFLGGSQVTARKSRKLREQIFNHCKTMGQNCTAVGIRSHSSNTAYTTHLYEQSRLCLMPGGDFPTRKAFLDAMLAGCIPVIFQPFAAQTQWLHHWTSEAVASQCTILIPLEEALADTRKTMLRLVRMASDSSLIRGKVSCIANISNRFQYSLPSRESPELPCEPNAPDAFDVSLQIVFTKGTTTTKERKSVQ